MHNYLLRTILITLLLTPLMASSQDHWNLLNPTPTNTIHYDVYFFDNQTGYILNEKVHYKTEDGGDTWFETMPLENGRDMDFIGEIGYLTGKEGLLLKTEDGGKTWGPVPDIPEKNYSLVQMIDLERIYLLNSSGLTRSIDGGQTWNFINFPSHGIRHMTFVDSQNGYAVGEDGLYLRSMDGGSSWQEGSGPFSDRTLYHITFATDSIGFVIQDFSGLYRTKDAGNSWEPINANTDAVYTSSFPHPDTGYIAGYRGYFMRTTDGGDHWEWGYRGGGSFDHRLNINGMHFIDSRYGFFVGANGRIAKTTDATQTWKTLAPFYLEISQLEIRESGVGYALYGNSLYRTTDGGYTWKDKGELKPDMETRSFFFVDDFLGYAICNGPFSDVFTRHVYKTTNGGSTWNPTNNGDPLLESPERDLTTLYFLTPTIGFASGGGVEGRTFKTTNGGISWQRVLQAPLNKIHFVNSQVGFASRNTFLLNYIYKTENGGDNWSPIYYPEEDITDFHFISESRGFIFSDSKLITTINGGLNWHQSPTPSVGREGKMYFDQISSLYMIGENKLYRSTNRGNSWSKQLEHSDIRSISVTTSATYAYGKYGILLKGSNMPSSTTQTVDTETLLHVYPNPFDHTITIHCRISDIIKIEVFNHSGQLIYSCLPASIPKIQLDLSHVPAGAYLIKAKLDNHKTISKKIIKQ